jgi:hypothetical protein
MHVKAHQEEKKPFDKLTIEGKINVKADKSASEVLAQITKQKKTPCTWHLPQCKANRRKNNVIQSSNEVNTMRWGFSEFNLQRYYSKKFIIPIQILDSINWASLRLARNRLSPSQHTFSIKRAIGWTATGLRLQRDGHLVSSCPCCKREEDTDHIILCPSRTEPMEKKFSGFQEFMQEIQTAPFVQKALSSGYCSSRLFPWKDTIDVAISKQHIVMDQ